LKKPSGRKKFARSADKVPLLKPWLVKPQELLADYDKIWASGKLSLGEFTTKLEARARQALGVREAIAISSCTSGLILTLKALGIKKKVVVPDYTFPATSHSVLWAGCEPRFCDVDLDDFTISVKALSEIEDPDVEAVMAVNIFGLPPRVDELDDICRSKSWKLIFDSAQGMGGEYKGKSCGGFGATEIFSMSPSKLVTSAEGGIITTNDSDLAEKLRQLRNYGKGPEEIMVGVGLSARMSELCAALAYRNLGRLKQLRGERLRLVKNYEKGLSGLKGIAFQRWDDDRKSGHNYFVIRITEQAGKTRDQALNELAEAGIECKRYFYPATHQVSAYQGRYLCACPNAEKLSKQAMAIPLFSGMKEKEQARVIEALYKALAG